MERPDLLALSADDLATLANRGLVKRAQREVESGEFTVKWQTSEDGTIVAEWSDGVTSTLPGGKTVKDAKCTCAALELCRHVIRTILAWQGDQDSDTVTPAEPWDPGTIEESSIETQVSKQVRERAAVLWSQGVLGELLRAAKPSARFHCPGHTVRFPVPHDLRYAQCSCSEPSPCVHAVLAIRAFRRLDSTISAGIISEGPLDAPVPAEPVTAAVECLHELFVEGFASLTNPWRDRVKRISAECAGAQLYWPAQILDELAHDFEMYHARDAFFSPRSAVARTGELLLRLDAISVGTSAVPQAFIRGMKIDRDTDLGAARFIGLGASVVEERAKTTVTVYLQDSDSSHVVTLMREFTEDPDGVIPRKSFHQLGRVSAVKDASLALLAAGQLVTQGGRRTAAGKLVIGRARAVLHPQNFSWEQLKAPVLVEDFSELAARLRLLPPASFRPRRAASDFHVCPIESVEAASFDAATNSIVSVLKDVNGGFGRLVHPWSERGKEGADALLKALSAKPVFVAGHVRAAGPAIVIHPSALVLANEGTARTAIIPALHAAGSSEAPVIRGNPVYTRTSRVHYEDCWDLAADIILNGLRRTRGKSWDQSDRAVHQTEATGHNRMASILREVQSQRSAVSVAVLLKLLVLANDVA